jgi:nitroreductase/NAD-dependent dihydropyrimidine dehydrogenase PreA subunit
MPLFEIDEDKCRRDFICVAECPASLVRYKDEDSVPVPLADREEHCIECGHCAAVCPHGALNLTAMPLERFQRIQKDLKIRPEQAVQFLKSRRSVRVYKEEEISREELARIIDAARYAPSGHNAQPVEWSVLASRAGVERFLDVVAGWMHEQVKARTETARKLNLAGVVRARQKGKDFICRGAPHLVCAHVPVEDGITPFYDGIIALSYLELAAHGLGHGACWCGYVNFAGEVPEVKEFLGIPQERRMAGTMMLGKPAVKYRLIPPREKAEVKWI